jgi:hypothetical protein
VYVFGNNVLFYDRPVTIGKTLTAWRVGTGAIDGPAGDLAFESPKATLDSAGRIQLLWAEPPAHDPVIPAYRWPVLPSASLWAASYDSARGWTRPAQIYSGPILWKNAAVGDAGGSAGSPVVAVPKEAGGVIVAAFVGGVWSTSTAADSSASAYASPIDLGGRRLLAVVRADDSQSHDINSIFLYRQDGEGPWMLWQQLQRSGERPALEVRLIRGAHGRLHLVWRQMMRENYLVIRHMHSDDGGASWTAPKDLLPGGLIQSLQGALDGCGRLHVLYEDWGDGPNAVRVGHAVWDDGWSSPQRLHPDYIATDFSLLTRADHSLSLAFLGTRGEPSDRTQWAMMISNLQ